VHFQISKCVLFQMKDSNKIAGKSGKISGWCLLLVMIFGNVLGPGCITKYGNIPKNSLSSGSTSGSSGNVPKKKSHPI
jgi:hypothetical protein